MSFPLSPDRHSMSPTFGARLGGFDAGGDAEPDNIFDRIRKMEMENQQDDIIFDNEQNKGMPGNLLNLSSSRINFPFASTGSKNAINQAPLTPQEVVSKLNDDPFLMKPLVTGEGFSIDDVYRYFTSFSTNETFSAALQEITDQMRLLAAIDSLCSSMGQLQDVELSILELENTLSAAFNNRSVVIWYNIPTAQALYSPTNKARVQPNVGIIGKTAHTQKRRTIANPKVSDWYKAESDARFFESAVCAVCSPLLDPLTHQLIAVISFASKTAWTNFDSVLLDHLETKLPHLLASLKISATKIRSTLAVVYSATGNELKQRPLMSNACQSLKSALNCEVAQIFFVNWQRGLLEFYGSGVGKKIRLPLSQGGIAAFVAQEGTLVNVSVASEHPHFGKTLDDEYRSRSIIAAPMINESSPNHEIFGVAVARAKRGNTVFDQHDAILLESLAAVTARTLSNFQRYRDDVLNLKRVLTAQDHYIELLTTAESLSSVIDKDQLFEMIMTRSRRLVSADRCSLFTTDRKREYLLSKVASGTSRSIVLPISQGIAGHVATTGQNLNIADAYEDERFNKDVDLSTGYRTKSILCLPIIGRAEAVIGVTQMINKQGENGVFTENDINLMKAFNVFCGIALSNANLFDDTNTMKRRVEGLLNLAMSMSREQSLPLILEHISESAIQLINAERCTVFLMDSSKTRMTSAGNNSGASISAQTGIAGEVVKNKTILNIHDATKDTRYDPSEDQRTGFVTHNLLAAPIMNAEDGSVLGIVQLLNKVPGYDGLVFTEDDERLVTAMASFAGFSIAKVKLQDMNAQGAAVFDLFNGGMEQIGIVLQQMHLTEEEEEFLKSPQADTRKSTMDQRLRLIINCFLHYNLLEKLNIPFVMFFQSLMLLQAVSRDFPYHNTEHALDTIQCVFTLLQLTGEAKNLDDIELFALLLAALMHDTGHSGENGGFVARSQLPLDILFKNQPPTQTNHANAAIQMLTNKKVNIIDGLPQNEQQKFWNIFIQLILSSGTYKEADFVQLWKSGDHSKLNTMRLFLKIANMSNVARPYEVAMNHGMLLHKELEQVLQEEKMISGNVPDPKLQEIIDMPLEQSELKFSQEIVLPLLEIAAAKWKPVDVFRQQLLENMRKWKELVKQ
ncbi:3'5'-cyclic nucleotide phosphodiesterase family protein [Tritrichomonas foetus]|uniref:3'5'-cyclic nucleotide phosphodiesterase family protein n=1 Tax=Tritrichomonas foetus TaxID=1144522 RepID=A0A1J4JK64_9EUKA|nr:3'5'-cyclic nucleotide phosphodiesterase family protein [Tritrichomonas foetus]|eukprot:OHS99538.1 3'5'-cyclic nucleotide phosphodiesterase family protein [Tritrichomonas foetus]